MHITRLLALLIFVPFVLASAPASVTLPLCSAAQHDSYKTTGPDGQQYATWHPQVDPYYGCYFDHEHGSNPALYQAGVYWQAGSGKWPAFGYSAAQMGMSEGHAGFKVYVFEAGGQKWMITQHQGTARADIAACARHHTLDVQSSDGISIYGMADFGGAFENTTDTPICGVVDSNGLRKLPVGPDSVGYEPWRADVQSGTLDARLTFNTINPQTACADLNCTSTLTRPNERGTMRILTVEWLRLNGVNLLHATCAPYGADYWYDCTGQTADAEYYRRMPFVTGSN